MYEVMSNYFISLLGFIVRGGLMGLGILLFSFRNVLENGRLIGGL